MREAVHVEKPWVKTVRFSQGVLAEGRFLFTSGITARDRDGKVVGAADMRTQILKSFENLGDVLGEIGAEFRDVIKWTMYTTDIDAFLRCSDVWQSFLSDFPASTLLEVRRFVLPEMLVEIEAVVHVRNSR
jgi:2-iminobutanoate/2-iminopropanoate deaminase